MTDDAVRRLLEARAPRETAAHALRVSWPLLQKISHRRYAITGPTRIAADDAAAALSAATGQEVRRVILASSTDERGFLGAIYDDRVDYDASLSSALRGRNWVPLVGMLTRSFGADWQKVRDEIWSALKSDVASPLDITFWDDPDRGPAVDVAESLMTGLFYYVALAVAGDLDRLAALDPLMRTLCYGVPIGACKDAPGDWIVALAPVARR